MATITVDYDRVPDYPKESISREGIQVIDLLQCAWLDRITLAKELTGFTVGGIVHHPKKYDAGEEPLNNVYCVNVDISPIVGLDATTGDYSKAQLAVTYQTLNYNPDDVPDGATTYVSEALEPAAEFVTLNNNGFYWATGGGAADKLDAADAPSQLIRMTDWVYTIHHLLSIPRAVFELVGRVNKYAVYSRALDIWFAPETLLCGNPSMNREVTSEGVTAWTVTFRFTHRNNGTYAAPLGWNYWPKTNADTTTLTWSLLYPASGTTAVDIYKTADFAGLIA